MLNAVGREIPDEILKLTGKEPFQGNNYKEGVEYRKQGPIVKPVMDHNTSKWYLPFGKRLKNAELMMV